VSVRGAPTTERGTTKIMRKSGGAATQFAPAEVPRRRQPPRRWLELSRTPTVRALGVLQAIVIVVTAACLVLLTSVGWLVAVVAGVAISLLVNVASALSVRPGAARKQVSPCDSIKKHLSMSRVLRSARSD
jgi:hypothetical protein